MADRIVVLLGAGASIPAGMPSTKDITERILSGERVVKETDDTYYLGDFRWAEFGLKEEYVRRAIALLGMIRDQIQDFYDGWNDAPVNYEDLAYFVTQLFDCLAGEYENPALKPCADQLQSATAHLLEASVGEDKRTWNFLELLEETNKYVSDVVWRLLSSEPTSHEHLSFLKEALQDYNVSNIDLFTLNHDTVIESFLEQEGIPYSDGFGQEVNEVHYWALDLALSEEPRLRVLKLHGSVDWFRLHSERRDGDSYKIGRVLTRDIWHTRDQYGELQTPVDGRPIILVGTFNKMLSYLSGIFTDIHCLFNDALRHTNRLIVVGYGFGDKGVNNRLIGWMDASPSNRLIVAHLNLKRLKSRARPAVARRLDGWLKQDRLRIIPLKIEDIDWQMLRDHL